MPTFNPDNPRNGVECPHCHGDLITTKDSRPAVFEGIRIVRRRRACATCEARVTTIEIPMDFVDKLRASVGKAMIIKLLDGLKGL